MKNTMRFLVLVAFVFAGFGASAQGTLKLGHLDTDKLLSVMPEFKAMQDEMKKKYDEASNSFNQMQAEFQKKFQEYQQSAKTMSDPVRASKEEELQNLRQRIDNFQMNASDDLEKTKNDLMAPILEKIKKAIAEVGKENGFTYIFAAGGLLFAADNSNDVFSLVKKKLGKR